MKLKKVKDSDQLIIKYIPMRKREGYVPPVEEKKDKKKGGSKKGSSKKKGGKKK